MRYNYKSINYHAQNICGDSFLCESHADHVLMVHSDGMGHGHKANVLSELTCEIVMSEWSGMESLHKIMKTLAMRLPICAVRGLGFSTFTLIDYNKQNGEVLIVEYENPPTVLLRGTSLLTIAWDSITVCWKAERREVLATRFTPTKDDRIIIMSDGVTQSGMGTEGMPFGWGINSVRNFILQTVAARPAIDPSEMNERLLNRVLENENHHAHDDISVTTLLF